MGTSELVCLGLLEPCLLYGTPLNMPHPKQLWDLAESPPDWCPSILTRLAFQIMSCTTFILSTLCSLGYFVKVTENRLR